MRVAADDDVESRGAWVEIEPVEVVQNVDGYFACFDDGGFREGQRPGGRFFSLVDVAADRGEGRERVQRVENLGFANVARMNEQIGTLQSAQGFRAQQTMGVGDEPNLFGVFPHGRHFVSHWVTHWRRTLSYQYSLHVLPRMLLS